MTLAALLADAGISTGTLWLILIILAIILAIVLIAYYLRRM